MKGAIIGRRSHEYANLTFPGHCALQEWLATILANLRQEQEAYYDDCDGNPFPRHCKLQRLFDNAFEKAHGSADWGDFDPKAKSRKSLATDIRPAEKRPNDGAVEEAGRASKKLKSQSLPHPIQELSEGSQTQGSQGGSQNSEQTGSRRAARTCSGASRTE